MFCLRYFSLNKHIINTATCFFPSYIQSLFLSVTVFYCFDKQEFGKFTKGISVTVGPARSPQCMVNHKWCV